MEEVNIYGTGCGYMLVRCNEKKSRSSIERKEKPKNILSGIKKNNFAEVQLIKKLTIISPAVLDTPSVF